MIVAIAKDLADSSMKCCQFLLVVTGTNTSNDVPSILSCMAELAACNTSRQAVIADTD